MNNSIAENSETDKSKSKINIPISSQKFIPSISLLNFPFVLKKDQVEAVNAWIDNNCRGTILYSTGTGKTEIAFECAKRLVNHYLSSNNLAPSSTAKKSAKDEINTISKDTSLNQNDTNTDTNSNNILLPYSFFNILFLVPRISLIDQTINRLISYGIPKEKVGAYFGERKEIAEIMISTYHSVIRNPNLIKRSNMVIFDEVHLIRDTSKSFGKIFDIVVEDPKKAILGLTATLDERDFKNSTILAVLPPVIKYTISKAVKDKRLAKPVVIPIKVSLTEKEIKEYNIFSTKIKNISNRFKRYDANAMTELLKKGGFVSGMAKAWFANIRKRKLLLSYAENKLTEAANIISKKFPDEKIMVFSETIESIEKLRDVLKTQGIESKIIDAKVKASERQKILNNWGITFNVLLSVHTLEIGYDVPQVRIEIILATTSNINQIVQRIGRVLRKHEGKNIALIYVIYVPDTKDDNVIGVVKKAIVVEEEENEEINDIQGKEVIKRKPFSKNITSGQQQQHQKNIKITLPIKKIKPSEEKGRRKKDIIEKEIFEKRIQKAYSIVESSLQQEYPIVKNEEERIDNNDDDKKDSNSNIDENTKIKNVYRVKSNKNKDKFYLVDIEKKSCTCADFIFRHAKCKHILATEIIST